MVVCCCNGLAIPENQNLIMEEILVKSACYHMVWAQAWRGHLYNYTARFQQALYYTDIGQEIGKLKNVAYISTDKEDWQPLSEFATQVGPNVSHRNFIDAFLFRNALRMSSSSSFGNWTYSVACVS